MNEPNNAIFKVAKNVRLFSGLDQTQLVRLIACATKCEVKEGELFFNEGDAGESFYILFIGQVMIERTQDGHWLQLATLRAGDSFGEMTLVDEKVRTARVRAMTDCVAMYFPMQRLKPHHDLTSMLFHNIAKVAVARLKISNSTVMDLSAKLARHGAAPEMASAPAIPAATQEASSATPPAPAITAVSPTPAPAPAKAMEKPGEWWLETTISG